MRISRLVQNGSMISSSSQILVFSDAKVMAMATGKPTTRHSAVVSAANQNDLKMMPR